MGKYSKVEWTDHSHGFWEGCRKVSQGCKYCYAERIFARYDKDFSTVRRVQNFDAPLKWKEPAIVFVCPMSDFFISDADGWRDDAWDIIRLTPHLTYMILTKREDRIAKCLPKDWGAGWRNVWLGVSIEGQPEADRRIPIILEIPAFIKLVSCEPLLGPITMKKPWLPYGCGNGRQAGRIWLDGIDLVIVGGESGYANLWRECKVDWVRNIRDECVERATAFFLKQWGGNIKDDDGVWGGRELDGRTWDEMPLVPGKQVPLF